METLVFGVLRWVVIAVLVVVTLFPMYYMVVLSHGVGDRRTLHNSCDSPTRYATAREGCDERRLRPGESHAAVGQRARQYPVA